MGLDNMGTAEPYVMVMIDTANEMAKVRGSSRTAHVQDRINFLLTWFEATWSEQPICFLYGPFTFKWIHCESIVVEAPEDGVEELDVMLS